MNINQQEQELLAARSSCCGCISEGWQSSLPHPYSEATALGSKLKPWWDFYWEIARNVTEIWELGSSLGFWASQRSSLWHSQPVHKLVSVSVAYLWFTNIWNYVCIQRIYGLQILSILFKLHNDLNNKPLYSNHHILK